MVGEVYTAPRTGPVGLYNLRMPLLRRVRRGRRRRPLGSQGALVLGAIALVGASGCGGAEPLARNAILISIDTLRPDHLGCYGYGRPTSPNLDDLCRESVVFEQAISHAPSTLSSHASMLSSLLPHQHGASIAAQLPLPEDVTTLPEVLQERGYRTASFNDGAQMDAQWDLDQGFDVYESSRRGEDLFESIVSQTLDWLDGEDGAGAPFFLLLHTYEVHHPYTPSTEDLAAIGAPEYDGRLGREVEIRELEDINRGSRAASPEDLEYIEAAYDAEIRSMDRALGRLVAGLRARGLLEETLLIFTSDHGEEFNEHGSVGWHSHTLYDELLRVPLILRFPEGRWPGERVRRQVRLIDLAPTVVDALGHRIPSAWRGVSLVRVLEGEEVDPLVAVSKIDGREEYSLRTGAWKLYRNRLFDLRENPAEDYYAPMSNWQLYGTLTAELERIIEDRGPDPADPIELDPQARKRLESLGYL